MFYLDPPTCEDDLVAFVSEISRSCEVSTSGRYQALAHSQQEERLPTKTCILFASGASEGVLVPVPLDRDCLDPCAIDLQPDPYLHRKNARDWKVRLLNEGSFLVSKFPPDSKLDPIYEYRFFYTADVSIAPVSSLWAP
jgi:hypothetical protein